uniref:alanine transaminase n=1 Tax=Ditylenchus dipsaci TaxID=166011 RepID=A0A915DKH4_9BILA
MEDLPLYAITGWKSFGAIRKLGHSSVAASSKILTMDTINPNVKTMEYAVRGPIVMRSVEIEREMAQGKRFLFENVIKANIGDCHAMGQTPITFVRQVVACITVPELLDSPKYPQDVKDHAKEILHSCAGGSVGAYSQSTGIELIRRHVAKFIERRDGHLCDWENVILSGGASESIRNVLKLFINKSLSRKTGVMIPVPQYPLYSATIEEFNLVNVGYYLDESNNWALDIEDFGDDHQVRIQAQSLPFADEVYQENVYATGSRFFSFRKIILEMGEPYCHMELASFYSCSKGYMGECGLRGGYVELLNMDEQVMVEYKKMISAKLCSTIVGQAAMDCIVNHPKPGDPSYDLWIKEKTGVLDSLKERAQLVTDAYNAIEGITVQQLRHRICSRISYMSKNCSKKLVYVSFQGVDLARNQELGIFVQQSSLNQISLKTCW